MPCCGRHRHTLQGPALQYSHATRSYCNLEEQDGETGAEEGVPQQGSLLQHGSLLFHRHKVHTLSALPSHRLSPCCRRHIPAGSRPQMPGEGPFHSAGCGSSALGLDLHPCAGWRSGCGRHPRQEGSGTGSRGAPPYLAPELGTPRLPPGDNSASGTSTVTCGARTKRRPLWTPTCSRRSRTTTSSPSGAALAWDRNVFHLGQRGGTGWHSVTPRC